MGGRLLSAHAVRVPARAPGEPTPLHGPVDLEVATGEVLVVEGPSGSGKTTLLRSLALLEARAEGEVRFRGERVLDRAVPGFRRQVVYVPQQPPDFPCTVGDSLSRTFDFSTAGDLRLELETARSLFRRLRLPDDVLGRRLGDLSVGEGQRVVLVRSLLVGPKILLLDEPTSALDPDARSAVVELLEEWRHSEGCAAVLVTHDAELADGLGTRRYAVPTRGDAP